MAETDFTRYAHQDQGPDFFERPRPAFAVRPTDIPFGPRAAADPGGPCSRCGEPLGDDGFPVWAFPEDCSFAYRFHPRCLGLESVDVDDELDEDGAIP